MNWSLVMFRGCLPATAVLAVGLIAAYATAKLQRITPLPLEAWHALLVSGAIAVVLMIQFYRRLLRWEEGVGEGCERCGGPLGALLPGKQYYGRTLPDYRRCYNCWKANASDQ